MHHIINDDCFTGLRELDEGIFDALITDPPYMFNTALDELMIEDCLKHWLKQQRYCGRVMDRRLKVEWDNFCPSPALWMRVRRTMKEGAYGAIFAGAKTLDLMTMSLRLAGFQIRDVVMWTYSSGMPRGHSVERLVRGQDPEKAPLYSKVGTTLKPAYEPIVIVRNPASLNLAQNAIMNGPVGLQVGAARIGSEVRHNPSYGPNTGTGYKSATELKGQETAGRTCVGRYPSNWLMDEQTAQAFDEVYGGASRFFYVDKPSKQEKGIDNDHPTVKPLSLMRYIAKLVSPDGGNVLDPFAGSGTTGIACKLENMSFTGFEANEHYARIARTRIDEADSDRYKPYMITVNRNKRKKSKKPIQMEISGLDDW